VRGDLGVADTNLVTDGARFSTLGVVLYEEATRTVARSSLQDLIRWTDGRFLGDELLLMLSVRCGTVWLVCGFSARIVVEAPRASSVRCVVAGDELLLTGIRTLNGGEFVPGGITAEQLFGDLDLAETGLAPPVAGATTPRITAKGANVPGPTTEFVKIVRAGVAGEGVLQCKLAVCVTMRVGCDENRHNSSCTCSNCCTTVQASEPSCLQQCGQRHQLLFLFTVRHAKPIVPAAVL